MVGSLQFAGCVDTRLTRLWWTLRIGFGVIFLITGTDKFLNLMTYWPMYVSEVLAKLLPVSTERFMHVVGVVELLIGLGILTKVTRTAAYLASLWLIGIATNLVTAGLYDLASRDIAIALGGFALARLTEIVHGEAARERAVPYRAAHAAT